MRLLGKTKGASAVHCDDRVNLDSMARRHDKHNLRTTGLMIAGTKEEAELGPTLIGCSRSFGAEAEYKEEQ